MLCLNCKISTKVIVSLTVSLVLVITTAIWTYQVSNNAARYATHTKNESLRLANIAHQMEKDVIQIQQSLTYISATRGLDGLDDGFVEAEKHYQSLLSGMATFRKHFQESNDNAAQKELKELQSRADYYYAVGKEMAQTYIDQGPSSGNKAVVEFDEISQLLSASLQSFIEHHGNMITEDITRIAHTVKQLIGGELTVFALMLVILFAGTWLVFGSILAPLKRSMKIVQKIASGDLEGNVRFLPSNDEIGELNNALAELHKRLQQIVGEVRAASDDISNASREITGDNNTLSQVTDEQASMLSEVTASVSQLSESVAQNAENTEQASRLADSARNTAGDGALAITNTIGAMDQVDEISQKISDITTVIDTISFQTNLLAINASVEAARAGDSGRGFSVVANEVRSLSTRSADSAKEIKKHVEESVKRIENFSKQVDLSGEALAEILGEVRQVSEFVSNIANANRDQSVAIGEVNRAMNELDRMTAENSKITHDASRYAERLKERAEKLNMLVHFFKLDMIHSSGNKKPVPKKPLRSTASDTFDSLPRIVDTKRKITKF